MYYAAGLFWISTTFEILRFYSKAVQISIMYSKQNTNQRENQKM